MPSLLDSSPTLTFDLLLLHLTSLPLCRKVPTFLGLHPRKTTSNDGYMNIAGCRGKEGPSNIPSNTTKADHSSRCKANATSFGKGLEDGVPSLTKCLHAPARRRVGLGTGVRGFRRASLLALLSSGLRPRTLGLAESCSKGKYLKSHARELPQ